MTLTGKRALVTGGGTGIGAAIATALAAEGADVLITGRRDAPLREIADTHDRMRWALMDVTDEASVVETIAEAGEIDILIANAGIAETMSLAKTTMDFWRRVQAVNVEGTMLCLRETLPAMALRGWGRAIVISSTAGLKGFRYGAAYAASKHAVLGLMKSAAEEVLTKGVTVNALCPGYVATPIIDRSVENIVARTDIPAEDALATLARTNPFGRLIEPAEVAAAALWLCRPGSGAVTGQAIPISGGQV